MTAVSKANSEELVSGGKGPDLRIAQELEKPPLGDARLFDRKQLGLCTETKACVSVLRLWSYGKLGSAPDLQTRIQG